jgi:hypothetical protein
MVMVARWQSGGSWADATVQTPAEHDPAPFGPVLFGVAAPHDQVEPVSGPYVPLQGMFAPAAALARMPSGVIVTVRRRDDRPAALPVVCIAGARREVGWDRPTVFDLPPGRHVLEVVVPGSLGLRRVRRPIEVRDGWHTTIAYRSGCFPVGRFERVGYQPWS